MWASATVSSRTARTAWAVTWGRSLATLFGYGPHEPSHADMVG